MYLVFYDNKISGVSYPIISKNVSLSAKGLGFSTLDSISLPALLKFSSLGSSILAWSSFLSSSSARLDFSGSYYLDCFSSFFSSRFGSFFDELISFSLFSEGFSMGLETF